MTYICAGKGSPGRRGWVGVAAEVGRRTRHPSTLSVPLLVFSHPVFVLARASNPGVFSSPPVASCARRLWRQAGSGAGLFGGQVCAAGETLRLPGAC